MSRATGKTLRWSLICIAAVAAAGCKPPHVPPPTVNDLMEDRVTLDGIVMKCKANERMAQTDVACENARIAIERLASRNEAEEEAKRQAEFERKREELRLAREREQAAKASTTKVDAYHLPLVPVEPPPAPAPAPAPSPTAQNTPAVGQTN
jgi:hypothetical protein